MDKSVSLRTALFLIGLGDTVATVYDLLAGVSDRALVLMDGLLSHEAVLVGLCAMGIGLMAIAGYPVWVWLTGFKRRESERVVGLIRDWATYVRELKSGDVDHVGEHRSKVGILHTKIRNEGVAPPTKELESDSMEALIPYIEEYGVEAVRANRESIFLAIRARAISD